MGTLRGLRRLARFTVLALVVSAIATELAKPEAERTWQGRVMGVVPYDFRMPTWERIRFAYWNPDSDQLFSDRVFGVGWAINLYRARAILESAFGRMMGTPPPLTIRMAPRQQPVSGSPAAAKTRK